MHEIIRGSGIKVLAWWYIGRNACILQGVSVWFA